MTSPPYAADNTTEKRKGRTSRWAIWLLACCIVALVCVYVFERVIGHAWQGAAAGQDGASLASVVVEALKFLISSLIGFLFAKRTG